MSCSPKVLKEHGISSGDYRKIFTLKEKPKRVQKLIDLISSRIKDGYFRNLSEWRTFAAIDLADDVVFEQNTATFVRHLLDKKYEKPEDMLAELGKLGLKESDLFLDVRNKTGELVKMVNPPVFFKFLIPIVRSYCRARTASLFNQRNTSPLLQYKPLKKTARNRVLTEVITDIINRISTNYGYAAYLDQAIKQVVKYGTMISFPMEEWDCQEQLEEADDSTKQDPKFKKVTVKEGLRYKFPHPSRSFADLYNPMTTMNTDSGCEFAAFWEAIPYSRILDNREYWNRTTIAYGTNWFNNPLAGNYFSEFYPCRLQFPTISPEGSADEKAAFYSSAERDKAVFLTVMYMKIIPRDWDLGKYVDGKLVKTYNYPVWHRFYMAGDSTVIWAEPCVYNPLWFMGYDYNALSARQTSLGLETIPWQDHLGNIVSQMMLTAKQNLANFIFYDTNIVNKTDVDALLNLGENRYRSMNLLPFDSQKSSRAGLNMKDAFVPVQLTYRTIQDMMQMMGTVLDLMERVLQFTAQEVGATAKHYQSAEEIKTVSQYSDQQLNYIGSSIDAGTDAWKIQIFTAALAYMDAGFEAEVSEDIPDVEKVLKELGFEISGKSGGKIQIKGDKGKIDLQDFARIGGDDEPDTDQQTAQMMFTAIGVISSHPELSARIGADKIIKLIEQAAKIGGADRDFKLGTELQKPAGDGEVHPDTGQPMPQQEAPAAQPAPQVAPPAQPDTQSQVAPMIQELTKGIMAMVEEKVAKPVAAELVKQEQQIQQLGQLVVQIETMLKGAMPQPVQPVAQPPAQPLPQ